MALSLDAKSLELILPVVFQGRWINHQYIGVSAIRLHESLGYHRGDDGLAETHHIGKEETVVLHQHLIALYHGIVLIANVLHAIRHLHREVVLHLRAKGVYQYLHIEFVRGYLARSVRHSPHSSPPPQSYGRKPFGFPPHLSFP